MTPDEQQAAYAQAREIASNTIDWAEGQQKVRGYISAGWRIREAGSLAETLFGFVTTYGPEEIFGDTSEAKVRSTTVNSLMWNIASLKTPRR